MTNAFSRGRLVAATVCLSVPCLAQAGNNSSTAEASIRNLSYRLVDLAPNDGQAPWLTTSPESLIGYGASVAGHSDGGFGQINPLPVTRLIADAGPGAFAEAGPDVFITKTSATDPSRLTKGTVLVPFNSQLLDWGGRASISVWDSPDREGLKGLVLAPHTQLIFEGEAFLSTLADAGAVLTHDGQPLGVPYLHHVGSLASIRMHLGISATGDHLAVWEADSWSASGYDLYEDGAVLDGGLVSESKTLPFLLVLTNNSNQALNATFDWSVRSESQAWVMQVPEPQTWGLVLAGLLVIPGARRTRKALR